MLSEMVMCLSENVYDSFVTCLKEQNTTRQLYCLEMCGLIDNGNSNELDFSIPTENNP